jgi:uncharacterized iron-regulated membrane protein
MSPSVDLGTLIVGTVLAAGAAALSVPVKIVIAIVVLILMGPVSWWVRRGMRLRPSQAPVERRVALAAMIALCVVLALISLLLQS